MIRKLIVVGVLLLSSFSGISAVSCDRWDNLDLQQKATLHIIHFLGQEHDLGWTLAAISLAESNAGKWRLNYISRDFGSLQINIQTAGEILEIKNRYNLFELAERLLYDDVLSVDLAVDVLHHFQRNRVLTNRVYKEMIMSYNRGYRWRHEPEQKKIAEAYYTRVQTNVRMLKQCSDLGKNI